MRLELKMKIHTPYGKADKMIIKDGEILFVTEETKWVKDIDSFSRGEYKTTSHEYSLGECTIYVEEDKPEECACDNDRWD